MKKIFKIKWELIITILVAVCVFLALGVYDKYDSINSLLLVMIPFIILCGMLASYTTIKEFRQTLYNIWK